MDNAVALVRAYLNINGYFTVAEYPVLEALRHGGFRAATDIDILAFRFPKAKIVASNPRQGNSRKMQDFLAPDTMLGVPEEQPDMLIGEVKEGRAAMNPAMRDAAVLSAVLARFGCCAPEHIPHVVENLLHKGEAESHCGHRIRMVAFGSTLSAPNTSEGKYKTISMRHVVRFLNEYLNQYWDVLNHVQFKDPAFGFLIMLEKALRGSRE